MPKTLERVTLPQPHSSCWQALGCLSPLCWTGIAGSSTPGRAVTDRRCWRRGTNWGKQSSSPGLTGQLRGGKALGKCPGLLLMGKGQGRGAEQERKDTFVRVCDPEQQHKVMLSSQLFATEGNDVTILFGLKNENYCGAYKHEKLICMPCHLEHYLPFHPGCCHIFHTMAQFLPENLLMDHFFLSLSHHGLHCAFLLGRHYPDLSGNYSSC